MIVYISVTFIILSLCPQDPGMVKELLGAAFNLYQSSHVMSATKRVLMLFFTKLVFSKNPKVSRYVVNSKWCIISKNTLSKRVSLKSSPENYL